MDRETRDIPNFRKTLWYSDCRCYCCFPHEPSWVSIGDPVVPGGEENAKKRPASRPWGGLHMVIPPSSLGFETKDTFLFLLRLASGHNHHSPDKCQTLKEMHVQNFPTVMMMMIDSRYHLPCLKQCDTSTDETSSRRRKGVRSHNCLGILY